MKIPPPSRSSRCGGDDRRQRAFTLSEFMVAGTLLVIVLGGAVASHIFGLVLMEKSSAKTSASSEAGRNIAALMSEVCSAKNVVVGNGDASSFSELGPDTVQNGSALQIYPSNDTNAFIRYFLDPATGTLNRLTNGVTTGVVRAGGISNSVLFTAEDFAGTILSNNQNNCVIGLTLQFCQVHDANWPVGPNRIYSSYRVQSKMARRAF